MSATIEAPVDLVESVAHLRLPPIEDARLQELMDANNNGTLTVVELEQLASLVEWSESLSFLRARALRLLGEQPACVGRRPLPRLQTARRDAASRPPSSHQIDRLRQNHFAGRGAFQEFLDGRFGRGDFVEHRHLARGQHLNAEQIAGVVVVGEDVAVLEFLRLGNSSLAHSEVGRLHFSRGMSHFDGHAKADLRFHFPTCLPRITMTVTMRIVLSWETYTTSTASVEFRFFRTR